MTDIAIERTTERTTARDPGRDGSDDVPGDGGPRDTVARAGEEHRRHGMDPLFGVRTADIEPYTGLRYLSKLFRMIAVILMLLLVAEVITGLRADGTDALTTLLAEVSRLIVLSGLLWGAGDLAILLIDVGHDVRAARIMIARQTSHLAQHPAQPSALHAAPVRSAGRADAAAAHGDASRS